MSLPTPQIRVTFTAQEMKELPHLRITTKALMDYARSKGRVKRRYLDMDRIAADTIGMLSGLPAPQTRVGDWVRVAYNAKRGDTVKAAPILPARLSKPLRVTGAWPHGVRIGGDSVHTGAWFSSWVRCSRREPDPDESHPEIAP